MTAAVICVAALAAFVALWQKFGFKRALGFASMIVLMVPGYAMAGLILPPLLRFLGIDAPSMMARIVVGIVVVIAACLTAKKTGWGNLLGWALSLGTAVCCVVIAGYIVLLLFASAHTSSAGGP